ncbi:MAG TPA: Hsp20/alpha crystallin family protein [Gammaproteobacteria bacterium]|nr:Hsp20/alpha crystallin family protein [Gammaproteobacteria bacterium]
MSYFYRNPWNLFEQLQQELNRGYNLPAKAEDDNGNVVTSDWSPAVDIKEEPNRFLITVDVPGVDPDKIEVHMENGMLSIKGERESEKKTEREGYKRIEREHGVFYRRFTMPDGVNASAIEANSKNGVLTISIPKAEAAQPRRITVN